MTCERLSVQYDTTIDENPTGERNGSRVQKHDVNGIGTQVLRRGARDLEPRELAIDTLGGVDGDVHVAARRPPVRAHAAEHIREVDTCRGTGDGVAKANQPLVDVVRNNQPEWHAISIYLRWPRSSPRGRFGTIVVPL